MRGFAATQRRPLGRVLLGGRAGQAMLEYVMVTAVMLACVAILAVLLVTTREQGSRVVDLVAADDP